jgi:hypothetical protein
MKTKKPRSAKAVMPAARTLHRAARTKPKAPRRKPSPTKAKGGKGKTPKKPTLPARGKTKIAVKAKTVKKRVTPKARVKRSRVPAASEQPASPVVAAYGQESEANPLKQAKTPAGLKAERPWEKSAQPDSGPRIPQILLEGDEAFSPPMTGLGQKYALGPMTPAGHFGSEEAALPEAYGTGKLLLAARDPHWLYAHWDLTHEQQRRYNSLSVDRHLVLRVHSGTSDAPVAGEVHLHPESRHWFVHVERSDAQYVAELGYFRPRHHWVTIAVSPPAITPAATASTDQTVRFATIPAHVRLTQLAALAKQTIPADLPPADVARERALAEMVAQQFAHEGWASSADVAELVRGQGEQETSAAQVGLPAPLAGEVESVSSPTAPAEQRSGGFWFNINAELVIYGATEPGASVTVGGRPISLRPDGTFSCRYSLPDGEHAVTVSALSLEGELRQATLKFTRRTDYQGEVGAAPQDPSLQPPATENP